MQLLLGILIGIAVTLSVWYWREHWRIDRRRRHFVATLQTIDLPFLVLELPDRRVHFSKPLAENLAVDVVPGMALEEVLERVVSPEDRLRVRRDITEMINDPQGYHEFVVPVRFRDGRWHELQLQVFRLGPAGLRSGILAATVADRTILDEVVEERDRLFNLTLDLLAVGDLDGNMLQVNPAWVRVLHWSRDEVMARSFPELIHEDDREQAVSAVDDLRHGRTVHELELRTLCRDGSFRWISWSSFPLTTRQSVFTVARDITERKAAEVQLARYQHRLQQLASQLAAVEEREMRRLAEILHDTLAQDLFAARAKLSVLRQPGPADVEEVATEVTGILDHATELTRALTFELFPPALYDVGLDAALEWLCRSIEKTRGLSCRFTFEGESADIAIERRTLLFQGARELLANVYKHAEASRADVLLIYDERTIRLRVDDDGTGFDMSALAIDDKADEGPGGFGLFNIRERLGQIGGALEIGCAAGGGGRVTLTIPRDSVQG